MQKKYNEMSENIDGNQQVKRRQQALSFGIPTIQESARAFQGTQRRSASP